MTPLEQAIARLVALRRRLGRPVGQGPAVVLVEVRP